MGSLRYFEADKAKIIKDLHHLSSFLVRFVDEENGGVIIQNTKKSSFVTEVKK